jgi:hypothetical protein
MPSQRIAARCIWQYRSRTEERADNERGLGDQSPGPLLLSTAAACGAYSFVCLAVAATQWHTMSALYHAGSSSHKVIRDQV